MSDDADAGMPYPHDNLISFAGKNDPELAKEYRERMIEVLQPILTILDEAKKHRMRVGFQLSPPDAFGRHHVAMLEILKEL